MLSLGKRRKQVSSFRWVAQAIQALDALIHEFLFEVLTSYYCSEMYFDLVQKLFVSC